MLKVLSLIIICGFKASHSCGGFAFDVIDPRNCGGSDQVIKLVNRSLIINKKCEVFSRSCTIIKPYKTAMMEAIVMDGSLTVSNMKTDICNPKNMNEFTRTNLYGWGIPLSCPMNISQMFCYQGNKLMTLSAGSKRLFSLFSVVKTVKVKITIIHDTGTSCFEGTGMISKI